MNRITIPLLLLLSPADFADESKTNQVSSKQQTSEDSPDYEAMIAALADIKTPGLGYSEVPAGLDFLPYMDPEPTQISSFNTYDEAPVGVKIAPAPQMVALVSAGVDAVPTLLKHLTNPIEVVTVRTPTSMMAQTRTDYDTFSSGAHPVDYQEFVRAGHRDGRGISLTRPHRVTVGDLCLVALGQIVNREFNSVIYEDSYLYISSPSRNMRIAELARAQWTSLTEESHRKSLRLDFERADSLQRRAGAYQRLSFYYPEETEALVLTQLNRTVIDPEKVKRLRTRLFYDFVPRVWDPIIASTRKLPDSDAILSGLRESLFDDLEYLESDNTVGRWETSDGGDLQQTRQMLAYLFNYPDSVTSRNRPVSDHTTPADRADLISRLLHDDSIKVGERVKQIFDENPADHTTTTACLKSLSHRRFGAFVREQLGQIDAKSSVTNATHVAWLAVVASTKDKETTALLVALRDGTQNPDYFASLATGSLKVSAEELKFRSMTLFKELPQDSTAGASLLDMVQTEIPTEAEEIYRLYMDNGSWLRTAHVCESLAYMADSDPMFEPTILLTELLDDTRGFEGPDDQKQVYGNLRICDLAAYALSEHLSVALFDYDWSTERRDRVIGMFKRHMNLDEVAVNPWLWLTEPKGLSPLRLSLLLVFLLGVIIVTRAVVPRQPQEAGESESASEQN